MPAIGMAPGGTYQRIVPYYYRAEWQFRDAVASKDPKATAFGPGRWAQPQGLIQPSPYAGGATGARGVVFLKRVIYLPVKRRDGQDTFPTLVISIKLDTPSGAQQARV